MTLALCSLLFYPKLLGISPFDSHTNFFIMMIMKNISIWSYMTKSQIDEYPDVINQVREFFKLLVLVYSAINPPTKEELETIAEGVKEDAETIKDLPLQDATKVEVTPTEQ